VDENIKNLAMKQDFFCDKTIMFFFLDKYICQFLWYSQKMMKVTSIVVWEVAIYSIFVDDITIENCLLLFKLIVALLNKNT
jgi:hypothetical protein